MKFAAIVFCLCALSFAHAAAPPPVVNAISLFDGETLNGWEGNPKLWRVADGTITGGSLKETIKENDFLCTTSSSTNFILRLKFKLTGSEGFVNSGIQIRSQ